MNGLTLAGIIGFMACLWVVYRIANWEKLQALRDAEKGVSYSEQIEAIFQQIWNGEEISREAAWYRTVQHLQHYDYPPEMVTEAELRLLMLQYGRHGRSHYTVNNNGRLVHITQIGGPDDTPPVAPV